MPLKVVVSGVEEDATAMTVWVAGQAKSVRRVEAYDAGEWHEAHSFIQPLSLTISPSDVSGFGTGIVAQTVTTDAATATPTGGLGPFTYAWTQVSGLSATIDSPSSATTTFSRSMNKFQTSSATFRCVCTDSLGSMANDTVEALFDNSGT